MVNMADAHTQIVSSFKTLNSTQRVNLIAELVDACTHQERTEAFNHLDSLIVRCNFLEKLPAELVDHIISFVDEGTLLTKCTRVSHNWQDAVMSRTSRWKIACKNIGASSNALTAPASCYDEQQKSQYFIGLYKKIYSVVYVRSDIEMDKTLVMRRSNTEAIAISVQGDIVARATSDHTVEFYNVKSKKCIEVIEINPWSLTSVLKFDDRLLICGTCNGEVTGYQRGFAAAAANALPHNYVPRHAKVLLWLEFERRLNLLFTFALDMSIKIWRLDWPYTLLHSISTSFDASSKVQIEGMLRQPNNYTISLYHEHLQLIHLAVYSQLVVQDTQDKHLLSESTSHQTASRMKLCITTSFINRHDHPGSHPSLCFSNNGDVVILSRDILNPTLDRVLVEVYATSKKLAMHNSAHSVVDSSDEDASVCCIHELTDCEPISQLLRTQEFTHKSFEHKLKLHLRLLAVGSQFGAVLVKPYDYWHYKIVFIPLYNTSLPIKCSEAFVASNEDHYSKMISFSSSTLKGICDGFNLFDPNSVCCILEYNMNDGSFDLFCNYFK